MAHPMTLSWSDSFATGITLIDQQHQLLFSYFHALDQVIAQGNTQEFAVLLHATVHYAETVHLYEENLLKRSGYQFWASHQDKHQAFRERLENYMQRLEQGEDAIRLARQLRTEIGNWALEHIRKEDQHYAACVGKSLNRSFVRKVLDKVRSNALLSNQST